MSSFHLTIDKHICMGRVQSVAILQDAPACGMEMMAAVSMEAMEDCCKTEQTVIKGNEHQVKVLKPVAIEYQSVWVATLSHVIETLDLKASVTYPAHLTYKPPLIEREIPILIQSFLIWSIIELVTSAFWKGRVC